MVENRIFIGNGNIISLILQDEILHKDWTGWIINQVVKEDTSFARAKAECEAGSLCNMYLDVIREEKQWADYLFNKGPVIGLNANIPQGLCGLHRCQCSQRNWHQIPNTCTQDHTYSLVQQARQYFKQTNCTCRRTNQLTM
jgi:hypothetical protein